MKKRHKLVVAFVAVVIMACGSSSEKIEANIKNSQKLKLGMTLNEALKIMGKPNVIHYYSKDPRFNSGITTYYYDSPFGASEWIFFEVDSANRVVTVTPFELKRY